MALSVCRASQPLTSSGISVLEGKILRSLIREIRQQVVLEVTEHVGIADYDAFHRSMKAFGPSVRLAVDDVGAGFASLRHTLELHPAFVKLDRSLVAGIDSDPARLALAAGLQQFARSTGARLIAEGVETERERSALLGLGIRLAQGYLLGRPGQLPD